MVVHAALAGIGRMPQGARLQDTWASWPASDFILMGRAHATKPEVRGFESVVRYIAKPWTRCAPFWALCDSGVNQRPATFRDLNG